MRDKLTGRVGRIISGTFHSLVDAVENVAPETVMEQAIREVEDAIEEVRTELAAIIAKKHLADTRLTEVNEKCRDLAEKTELAVAENRDDLAQAAISQQLDLEAQTPILETQLKDLDREESELESYITALSGKKREMHEELKLFKASQQQKNQPNAAKGSGTSPIEQKVDKAESAFARVMGMSSTSPGLDMKNAKALHELEDLAREHRVQERLAAIKQKRDAS